MHRALCDAVISLVPGVPRWLRRCGHRTARQGKPPTSAAGICLFQCGPEPRSPFFWRKKIFTSPERTTRRPGTGGGFQAGGAQPISQAADRPIDHVSSERRALRQLRAKEKRKEKKKEGFEPVVTRSTSLIIMRFSPHEQGSVARPLGSRPRVIVRRPPVQGA